MSHTDFRVDIWPLAVLKVVVGMWDKSGHSSCVSERISMREAVTGHTEQMGG